jgi:type I restriction enzyme S subunit
MHSLKEPLEHKILGSLPNDFVAPPLSELCTYIQRGTAPSYVEESDVRALNQKAIRWGFIEEEHLKFHDPEVHIADRHMLKIGDVVVNSTGDITIGRAFVFRSSLGALFADSHVTIIRTDPQRLKPEYLVNLLATSEYQDLIYSFVTGSTGQLELNKSNLEKLPILLPPVHVQESLIEAWRPLYAGVDLADKMRKSCDKMIRNLLDRDVLDKWKTTRWAKESPVNE